MQQVSHYIKVPATSEKVANMGLCMKEKVTVIAKGFSIWGFAFFFLVWWLVGCGFVFCFFLKKLN